MKIFVKFVLLAALFHACFCSDARAQVQPIPVYQAKGTTVQVFNAVAISTVSGPIDMTGFAGLNVFVTTDAGCTDYGAILNVFTGNTLPIDATWKQTGSGVLLRTNATITYFVGGGALSYAALVAIPGGVGCHISVSITPMPFPTMVEVSGDRNDYAGWDTSDKPVIIGGRCLSGMGSGFCTTALRHPVRIDDIGNVVVRPDPGIPFNVTVAAGGNTATAPGIPSTVSLAANTSGTICGLTSGAVYRVACGVAVNYRTGAAGLVALTTDSPLGAIPDREDNLKLNALETCVAFISSSAGLCYASLRP